MLLSLSLIVKILSLVRENCNMKSFENVVPYRPQKGRSKLSSTLNFRWSKFSSTLENFCH